MNEPTLNTIEDYNTLKGEKRRTVLAVIFSGLIIGAIYSGANFFFGSVDDQIPNTQTSKGYIPVK